MIEVTQCRFPFNISRCEHEIRTVTLDFIYRLPQSSIEQSRREKSSVIFICLIFFTSLFVSYSTFSLLFHRQAFQCSFTDKQRCVQHHLLPGVWGTLWVHRQAAPGSSSEHQWSNPLTGKSVGAGEPTFWSRPTLNLEDQVWLFVWSLSCYLSHLVKPGRGSKPKPV